MNTQKKVWQRVLPGMVIIALIVVFFVVFMAGTNKQVTRQNEAYVSDAAEQTASRIADHLYTAVRTLSNISEMCDVEEDNSYPEELKKVDNSFFSMIDYIAVEDVITQNGYTYYHGKLYGFREPYSDTAFVIPVTTNPSDEDAEYRYVAAFDLGMKTAPNEAGMLDEFSGVIGTDTNLMSFYTSLYDDSENKVGVLIGRYDEDKMKEILAASFFGEPSGVCLCTSDGTIITTTDERLATNSTEGQNSRNVLDFLQGVVSADTLQSIENSFQNGFNEPSFSFSYSDGTNACLAPLHQDNGISSDDWIILQTFHATVTVQMQRLANLEGLRFGLGLFFALAIYIGLILLLGHYENRKLVKANMEMTYVVDGLTKLYDRFIYVNLNERKYRYIGDTYPDGCEIPVEGDYEDFRTAMIATFIDDYEKTDLANKLGIEEIKSDMSDGTTQLRYEYRASDGQSRWDDLSLICLSRDENGAKEVLVARQNISELKEKELQNQLVLREAFRAAEDANKAKSDFLSSMSHDIRTPMNAVLGFSALIDQSMDKPEKIAEYNKKIQSAGQHLIELINDLLDMSRIESGKFTINLSRFSMAGLLDEISSVMAPQAKERAHTFNLSADEVLHQTYLGDRLRISQILINLISNAIKYTPEGGRIDVSVQAGKMLSDNISEIVFTISDNGIGMSEEFQKLMFKPFEREERALARKVQGTGLGLAITKNLIDLMGGTIDVQSQENVGTTFTIVLHLVTVEQTEHLASEHPSVEDYNPLKGKSFLVAEDNEINAEIISDLLEISGAKCTVAENGKIAVQMFQSSRPGRYDMILMDVQMPVMDGYAATRAIRESNHPQAKTIPILAMTANAFAEDVKNALDSGMNAHLSKPVSISAIKGMVEQLTNKNK